MRTATTTDELCETVRGPGAQIERTVGRGLGLPGTRAVVGGLLVALAVILLALGARDSGASAQTKFLITTTDLDAGSVIEASDLALAPMELYETTEASAYTDADDVVGKVALSPIERGGLVSSSSIAATSSDIGPQRSVALRLKPEQALNGSLRSGDRVDVVALGDESAEIIISSAVIVDVVIPETHSLGATDSVSLTVSVESAEEATKLVSAHSDNGITLIKASGLATER